jgi:hypothetical protein
MVALFLDRCGGGCREPPPVPPTCEERCVRGANAVREACIAAGGSAEECDASAAEFLAACNERCVRPEPPTCEDRCERAAEEAFAECVAGGGTEEDCRASADALLDACITRCNEARPVPCSERCAQIAREILARCQEAGAPAEECEARAAAFLARCTAACEPEPPTPPTCAERCADAAERVAAACAARGGTEEECAAVVAAFTERCNAHCEASDGGGAGALTASEALCAERGAELRDSCLASGRSAADCDLLTRDFEGKCAVVLGEVDDWLAMLALAPPRAFRRGDSNRDGRLDIADPINTLVGLFLGTGNAFEVDCLDRLDSNDDGRADLADPIYTLSWLFQGGPAPPAPGTSTAGHDPTFDSTICFE